jgi:hypothetical protein
MLCQMVCIDRRYQRMNCFNIREIQTLLKSKYHPDALNINEYHQFLNNTVIGLRFKLGGLDSIEPSSFLAFNYGVTSLATSRDQHYYFELEHHTTNYAYYLVHVGINKLYNFIAYCLYV